MALRQDPRRTQGHLEGSRDPRIIQYTAPQAPKVVDDAKRKEFKVAEQANIFDHTGEKRFGGETIMLSEEEATFYANLGYLTLDVKFDSDEKDDEIARLRSELAQLKRDTTLTTVDGGSEDAPEPDGEAGEEATADSSGGEHGDGDISPKPTRRKRTARL